MARYLIWNLFYITQFQHHHWAVNPFKLSKLVRVNKRDGERQILKIMRTIHIGNFYVHFMWTSELQGFCCIHFFFPWKIQNIWHTIYEVTCTIDKLTRTFQISNISNNKRNKNPYVSVKLSRLNYHIPREDSAPGKSWISTSPNFSASVGKVGGRIIPSVLPNYAGKSLRGKPGNLHIQTRIPTRGLVGHKDIAPQRQLSEELI